MAKKYPMDLTKHNKLKKKSYLTLNQIEQNLKNNGFLSTQNYPVISQDATVFVNQAIEKNEKWDLIIFDPPSFSNSHKMAQPFDGIKDANIWF